MILESQPEEYKKFLALTQAERDVYLLERLCQYDEKYFVRHPGETKIVVRGTRLTPQQVLDIERSGELADYEYVTREQVDACRDYATMRYYRTLDMVRHSSPEQYLTWYGYIDMEKQHEFVTQQQ
jgi:uncharacterized protein (DUF433 family)